MKKVIITGATSMIGISIVEACLKNDVEIIYAVVRPNTNRINRIPADDRIKIIKCKIEDYIKLPELINEKCDVFYHIAWSVTGENRNNNIKGQADNIAYTLIALEVASKLGCVKFIGAGSQAEYGKLDIDMISPDSPIAPVQPYGIAKYASGKLASEYAKKINIDFFWVRIFSVYGEYDKETTMISSTIRKLRNDEKAEFTKGEQRWDYLYSSDAGEAFYLVGEKSTGNKIYCLGSGIARPLSYFINIIGMVMNKSDLLEIGTIPYSINSVMNICADISSLNNDTGWMPKVSFEKGIESICMNID